MVNVGFAFVKQSNKYNFFSPSSFCLYSHHIIICQFSIRVLQKRLLILVGFIFVLFIFLLFSYCYFLCFFFHFYSYSSSCVCVSFSFRILIFLLRVICYYLRFFWLFSSFFLPFSYCFLFSFLCYFAVFRYEKYCKFMYQTQCAETNIYEQRICHTNTIFGKGTVCCCCQSNRKQN